MSGPDGGAGDPAARPAGRSSLSAHHALVTSRAASLAPTDRAMLPMTPSEGEIHG
jgi:hypothetical protein